MFRPHPIGFLQFGLFWIVVTVGAIALIGAFTRSRSRGTAARKSTAANLGIAIQAIGFAVTGFGPMRFALPWSSAPALIAAALVALLGGGAIAIFIAATRAMGENWAVTARTLSDHTLVRGGPFAVVRHPIYLALLLYMLSFAIAFGHLGQLLLAVPLYCVGATIRVREEEKLLRAQFGEEHARYVREVPAFIPFLRLG
jgi:protein-S-isoprenylcysteine O-methyltransferase Ste14